MIDLHRRHGKLVRTGPNEVSVSDLSAIKKIYGARTKFVKSDWYSVLQGPRKFDPFAERDERVHDSQRRLVSRIYSMEYLQDLEQYVDDTIAHFMEKMQERIGTFPTNARSLCGMAPPLPGLSDQDHISMITWHTDEAYDYMLRQLGEKEQIPQR
ncbi:hypothetical protein MMC28_001830 [Mycoblastus sanguinarius]|nr:hypothetical protein [Mycoblastus sanguinarius]